MQVWWIPSQNDLRCRRHSTRVTSSFHCTRPVNDCYLLTVTHPLCDKKKREKIPSTKHESPDRLLRTSAPKSNSKRLYPNNYCTLNTLPKGKKSWIAVNSVRSHSVGLALHHKVMCASKFLKHLRIDCDLSLSRRRLRRHDGKSMPNLVLKFSHAHQHRGSWEAHVLVVT